MYNKCAMKRNSSMINNVKRAGMVESSHWISCEWDLGAHSKSAITISRARVFSLELRWHRVTFTSLDLYI